MTLHQLLPNQLKGWKPFAGDTEYSPVNLHEYINGGAELFISYGFTSMISRKYAPVGSLVNNTKPGLDDLINVDIFDMGSSYHAFGVFSQGCETYEKKIGQGSQYSSGLLTFWKDRYYVSILAYPETGEKKKAVLALGRLISSAIPVEGPLPPLLSFLPRHGLREDTFRYFQHYIWLNSFYFISNDNILSIDKNTDVVLAKYRDGQDDYFILLVLYAGKEKAASAYENFVDHYFLSSAPGQARVIPRSTTMLEHYNIKKIADGKWSATFLDEDIIAAVFNADRQESIKKILGKIRVEIKRSRR